MEVAGPYYLDGSALNPETVELRRAGWGFAVLDLPELSTQPVEAAPPCFDASDDDAMEEDWLDDQLQESLGIDHAEATMTVEPTCEPKVLIVRFGCISGDHTVPHAEQISLLRAAQHATRFWKDDGSVLCFVSDCQLVVDSWKRGRQYCCGAQHWFADIWRHVFSVLDKKFGSRWRVHMVAAHQSRAEVDSGCLSRHAWLGNSKAEVTARSGDSVCGGSR